MLPSELEYEALFDPITSDALSAEELRLSCRFPKSYRDLVQRVNGFNLLVDYWFPLKREIDDMNMSELSCFYGIGNASAPESIAWAMKCLPFRERAPKDLVPFASDLNGFHICFRVRDSIAGSVVVLADWGHGGGAYSDPEDMVVPVCNSFDEFVEILEPAEEDIDL